MKTLGDSLRNAREEKNLTQKEVARITGINNKTISNYENSVSLPDPDTLKVLADIYETSVDYLLGRPDIIKEGEAGFDRRAFIDVAGLPEEAVKKAEEYIELLRLKYESKDKKRKRRQNNHKK